MPQARTQSTDVEAEISPSLWVAGIKDGIRSQASAGVREDSRDRAYIPSQYCLPEGEGRPGSRAGDDRSQARLKVFLRPSVRPLHQPGTEGAPVTLRLSLAPALLWGPAHEHMGKRIVSEGKEGKITGREDKRRKTGRGRRGPVSLAGA